LDALERDLKREKMGLDPTTRIVGEPSSVTYDPKKTLYEQFNKAQAVREGEGDLKKGSRRGASEDGENTTQGGCAGAGFGGANGGYPPGMGMRVLKEAAPMSIWVMAVKGF